MHDKWYEEAKTEFLAFLDEAEKANHSIHINISSGKDMAVMTIVKK
jgi:hypothetical protein